MDEWNLPENCKLRVAAVQNNDPKESQIQYRLRLAEDHKKTVSESTINYQYPKPEIIYVLKVLYPDKSESSSARPG